MSQGANQTNDAATRIAMEIDQALRLLAQAMPGMAPWVAQITVELKQQLAKGLTAQAPLLQGEQAFPDGSARL